MIVANLERSEDPAIGIAGQFQYSRTLTHFLLECNDAVGRQHDAPVEKATGGERDAIGREAIMHKPDLSLHEQGVLKLQLEHGRLATEPRPNQEGRPRWCGQTRTASRQSRLCESA